MAHPMEKLFVHLFQIKLELPVIFGSVGFCLGRKISQNPEKNPWSKTNSTHL